MAITPTHTLAPKEGSLVGTRPPLRSLPRPPGHLHHGAAGPRGRARASPRIKIKGTGPLRRDLWHFFPPGSSPAERPTQFRCTRTVFAKIILDPGRPPGSNRGARFCHWLFPPPPPGSHPQRGPFDAPTWFSLRSCYISAHRHTPALSSLRKVAVPKTVGLFFFLCSLIHMESSFSFFPRLGCTGKGGEVLLQYTTKPTNLKTPIVYLPDPSA